MKYKMLLTDMDDTLLNDNWEISEENLEAMRKLADHGVHVVLCSGRPTASMAKYAHQLFPHNKEHRFFISFNGAAINDLATGKELYHKGIPQDLAREVVALAESEGITAQSYKGQKFYVKEANERSELYARASGMEFEAVGSLVDFIDSDPLKILFNAPEEELDRVYPAARELTQGRMYMSYSKPIYLEFLNKEVNKGSAMVQLASQLGIKTEEIVAVGDSFNDREMLEAAGVGVAVANAREAVKDMADYVTTRSHSESALVEVIQKYWDL